MADRAMCPMCCRRTQLRQNGTIGAHKVTIYDGWEPPYRSIIGIVRCAGTGFRPGADWDGRSQTCGWCHKMEPCDCPGRH